MEIWSSIRHGAGAAHVQSFAQRLAEPLPALARLGPFARAVDGPLPPPGRLNPAISTLHCINDRQDRCAPTAADDAIASPLAVRSPVRRTVNAIVSTLRDALRAACND